ncbi:MAG: ABC transporter ATP-binding protein [Eubacteriales bacterium]|nr:ABC transporter ATP-binding protein [Eubacteriales bacterium]
MSGISFDLFPGKIYAVIGPNGGGKSTLLKTLIGHLPVVSGRVLLDTDHGYGSVERARLISVVMTMRPETELMTVKEIVESGRLPFTGRFGSLSEADKSKVRDAMELTDTLELADTEFLTLSDGQKTRAMLARAIAQDAAILVLDEPTAYLDINYKLELIALLKRLARERGTCVIMSVHELELVKHLADEIICIKKGEPAKIGSYEEIFTEDYLRKLFDIKVSGGCEEANDKSNNGAGYHVRGRQKPHYSGPPESL